jgi:hypothetical protein
MNHAITVGGLLLTLGLIVGLATAAIGALMVFAGGMSDAPAEGSDASRKGCFIGLLGLALFGASIWGMLS